MKATILIWVFAGSSLQLTAQDFKEKINKEFSFEKKGPTNALIVANINGSVKVEGYSGDKILVEVDKSIRAKTQERLDKGKSQIQLGVIDLADTIILYVDGVCSRFERTNHGNHRTNGRKWGYSWNDNCKNCRDEFDYTMNFIIKVPATLNVDVSTINDGNISVDHVNGVVIASNINGGIALRDLMRGANATTINGDVDIEYSRNPDQDCRFYSLNGDINAWFQKGLAASMTFESFNGDFFTNIDRLEPLPVEVEKTNSGEGIKYKVNGNRYKIGSGGARLDFETFNGNVYLKEKTN